MKKRLGTSICLMLLIYISLCGNYINKEITNNLIFLYGLIDFLVINTLMTIVPFSLKLLKKINTQNGKKICKYNSLIIFILSILTFIILKGPNYFGIGGLGAIIYYFINMSLFVQDANSANKRYKTTKTQDNIENKENDKWQEHLEKNYKATGTRTNMKNLVVQQNKSDDKIKDIENNKFYYMNELKLFLFAIVIFIIFLLLVNIEKQKNKMSEQEDIISNLKSDNAYYNNLSKEMQNKINFYDKYIVIIPQDSDYYMNYDCWNQKGRSDTFKIMNYKDAQNNGYKEYICNIRDNLGLTE